MDRRRASGYSTPEFAFWGGLLLLIVSLVVPGYYIWQGRQRLAMAGADLKALLAASRAFHKEYDQWPTILSGGLDDVRYGRDLANAEVMNVLRAVSGAGNTAHRVNRRKIPFLEVPPVGRGLSGVDPEGNFVDPWGQQYQFLLDASLDNNCFSRDTIYGHRENEGALIWSCGPDGISDTSDDLLSWDSKRR